VEHVDQCRHVEAGLVRMRGDLREQCDEAHRHIVVQQLHQVAGADRPHVGNVFAERLEQRAHAVEDGLIAADEQVEGPLLRVLRQTGHRGVDEFSAPGLDRRGHLFAGAWQRRGAVDHDRAGAQGLEHAAGTGQHGFDLRRACHAQDDDACLLRHFGG
jgi:hypothetical protein